MTEFLIPMRYTGGAGTYVCAGFGGLPEDEYDTLEIALEGGDWQRVERNPDDPWSSLPAAFPVQYDDLYYTVRGRVTAGDRVEETVTHMLAETYEAPVLRKAAKAVRLAAAEEERHGGGAISSPPAAPEAWSGDRQ